MTKQQTVKSSIKTSGIGLHSGKKVNLNILPAEENTGIVFRRVDLEKKPEIKATFDNVVDTKNSTNLGFAGKVYVRTIEHLMSALYIAEVDNAIVEIDNEETPIFDGSATVFYKHLNQQQKSQNEFRKILKIKKEIVFKDEKENIISIKPYNKGLKINFEIEFPSQIIGKQVFSSEITKDIYEKEIYNSRTFAEKNQIEYLQSLGLIKGGNLDNAVVLDGDKILNPEGLRHKNECVNHKVLDLIGDLYTSGYRICGELNAYKTGHFHSNELLKKLFSNKDNYEVV